MRDGRGVAARIALVAALALSLVAHMALVRRDLPYTPEVDEPDVVVRAVRMAGEHSLDPGWFGHPGSTLFHPLAALFAVRQLLADRHIADVHRLATAFDASPTSFYLLGRTLTIAYSLAALVLLERLGRRMFGAEVAAIAALVMAVSPLVVTHATMVRTDSACLLFSIVALGASLSLARSIGLRTAICAGCALGLAVATKYSLAALGVVLVVALALPAAERRPGTASLARRLSALLIAIVVAAMVFAATTPYLFVHFSAARGQIMGEMRTTHLGADGLSLAGNLRWYLLSALPAEMSWPAFALAVAGVAVGLRSEGRMVALPLAMIVAVLAEIAPHPLHWERWLLPMLPPLALFAALGASRAASWVAGESPARPLVLAALTVLAVAAPGRNLFGLAMAQMEPGTRVAARAWVIANVPAGARIAQEWYTAPLDHLDFAGYGRERIGRVESPRDGWSAFLWQRQYLAEDADLETYRGRRIDYIVTSSAIGERYRADPARYARQLAFYARLDTDTDLVAEFAPSARRAGPTVRLYRLARTGTTGGPGQ